MKKPMAAVVAARHFTFRFADGTRATVEARIGQPVEDAPSAWYCPYQIERFADTDTPEAPTEIERTGEILAEHAIWGVDSVQALYGALSIVGVEIGSLGCSAEVDWADMPNFGFPPMPTVK